jgi:uncharacterized protein YndB with AHSA1/START domain
VNRTIQIAPVRKSLIVEASPQQAFETFTLGIDRWWPKSHTIGASPMRASAIEPFVGGRWYSTCEDGSEVTVGHVQVWEPGRRLVFSWEINARWQADARPAFTSQVEVMFAAHGDGRTRVELEHRCFERMGDADGDKMRGDVDRGWPGLLELYANALAPGPQAGRASG